jgi:hypothetical protein
MTSTKAKLFATPAETALADLERIQEIVDCLTEVGERLDTLESITVDNDPVAEFMSRLHALESRMTTVEKGRLKFPLEVVINKSSRADLDAFRAEGEQQRSNLERLAKTDIARAHERLDKASRKFEAMAERLAAVEAKARVRPTPRFKGPRPTR